MKSLRILALLLFPAIVTAQHSLQLDNGTNYGIISASLLTGNRTYQLPDVSGTLITTGSLNSLAWMLGGNSASSPNNQLGTLDATNMQFITNGLANIRMLIDGTTGYIGMGTTPVTTYPFSAVHLNTTSTPPNYGTLLQYDLQPVANITAQKDALHVNARLSNSSANMSSVLDGIRTEVQTFPSYTGILDYAQGSNANIFHQSNTTLLNADASIGSVYLQGTSSANTITNARGAAGQVFNYNVGSISNAYAQWSRLGNLASGSITNAYGYFSDSYSWNSGTIANLYLFYGATPSVTAGGTVTNLTGLYLAPMNVATGTNRAIWYNYPSSPVVITGSGDMTVGFLTPLTNAKLTVYNTLTVPFGTTTSNVISVHNLSPNTTTADQYNNNYVRTNILTSSDDINSVVALSRGELAIQSTYTGTLAYAQGFNGGIYHQSNTTLANADGIIGAIYNQGTNASNIVTNARGAAGQVLNQGLGTVTNAFAQWSRLINSNTGSMTNGYGYYSEAFSQSGGNISNLYLFYGAAPLLTGGGTVTNLTGLFLAPMTVGTSSNRAIWYAHGTRPFVVTGNGEVSIGNAAPATGITLSLYPGSAGSTIQRLYRTAAGQYLATDYQPDGVLSATNPRWGTGLMGSGFQTGNYAIWTMNGAVDNPRVSVDYDGEVGIGMEPVGGTHNSRLTVQTDLTSAFALSGQTNNSAFRFNINPSSTNTDQLNNLLVRTTITGSNDITGVSDLLRGELVTDNSYTGTLGYAQGINSNIFHGANTSLANADAVIGSIYVQGTSAANIITNARGAAGQIWNTNIGTVTNAYAHWSRTVNNAAGSITNAYGYYSQIASQFGGNITNAYLFYGELPSTFGGGTFTNVTGLYLNPILSGTTTNRAIHYAHSTSPFVVTGAGDVGIGTLTLGGNKLAVSSTGLGTYSTTSSTADEQYAILGRVSGDVSDQVIGVWGDASNTSAANIGSIGVLATGNGNTGMLEQNIALQVADGEFTMGRTTEAGSYTVIDAAAPGTDYTAEGPSGVIEIDLGGVTFNDDNNMVSNETRTSQDITINNRYARTQSIVLLSVSEKVNEGSAPDPNDIAFTINCISRANGSYTIRIYTTSMNNLSGSGNPFQSGDLLRIGYMIVNPSR